MERGRLFWCCGAPRSGKTTFCQRWVRGPFGLEEDGSWPDNVSFNYIEDQVSIHRPRAWVNGDQFRLAICGQVYQSLSESFVFATMDVAIRALLDTGHDVIVDETSTTPATIKRYLRIDLDATPIWFDTPLDECLRRATETNKPFLIEPIKRIHAQLQELRAGWPTNFERMKEEVRARMIMDKM